MKTPFRKILLLAFIYQSLLLAEGCDIFETLCNCPPADLPYIDYQGIVAGAPDPTIVGSLRINIEPDSIEYVAQAFSPRLNLLTAAYGCKCEYNGMNGDKYPPVSIDVFADLDYNDTLPSGASLRSIFYGLTNGDIVTSLSDHFRPEPFRQEGAIYMISSDIKPKYLNEPYHFTIQWVKSNGDTLTAQTNSVVFQ